MRKESESSRPTRARRRSLEALPPVRSCLAEKLSQMPDVKVATASTDGARFVVDIVAAKNTNKKMSASVVVEEIFPIEEFRPPPTPPNLTPRLNPHRARRRCLTSRDFVPWRFSDAGRPSVSRACHCWRPKTRTQPDFCAAQTGTREDSGSGVTGRGRVRYGRAVRLVVKPG